MTLDYATAELEEQENAIIEVIAVTDTNCKLSDLVSRLKSEYPNLGESVKNLQKVSTRLVFEGEGEDPLIGLSPLGKWYTKQLAQFSYNDNPYKIEYLPVLIPVASGFNFDGGQFIIKGEGFPERTYTKDIALMDAIAYGKDGIDPYEWAWRRIPQVLSNLEKYDRAELIWQPVDEDDEYHTIYDKTFGNSRIVVDEFCAGGYVGSLYDGDNLVWSDKGLHDRFEKARGVAVMEYHTRYSTFKDGDRGTIHPELLTVFDGNPEIYGFNESVEDLVSQINIDPSKRWIEDVTISELGEVLSGNRRFTAIWEINNKGTKDLDGVNHPVTEIGYTVAVYQTKEEKVLRVIRENATRQKDNVQRLREARARKQAYQAMGKQRMIQGAKNSRNGVNDATNGEEKQSALRVNDIVGKEVGLSRKTLEKGWKSLDFIESKLSKVSATYNPDLGGLLLQLLTQNIEGAATACTKIQQSELSDAQALSVLKSFLEGKSRSIEDAFDRIIGTTEPTKVKTNTPTTTTTQPPQVHTNGSNGQGATSRPPAKQSDSSLEPPDQVAAEDDVIVAPGGGDVLPEAGAVAPTSKFTGRYYGDRFDKATDNWLTPEDIIEDARTAMGGIIHIDPAASLYPQTTIGEVYNFTAADNGLTKEWGLETGEKANIFANIPWSSISLQFFKKLQEEIESGRVGQAIFIALSGTIHNEGTQKIIKQYCPLMCLYRGRQNFIQGDDLKRYRLEHGITESDRPSNSVDVVMLYFGTELGRVASVYENKGDIRISWEATKKLFPG